MKNFTITLVVFFTCLLAYNAKAQEISKNNIAFYRYNVMIEDMFNITLDKPMLDSMYKFTTTVFSKVSGVNFKSADYLKGKVAYDYYGYPLGSIKKAVKSNMADNYAKITINLKHSGIITTKESETTFLDVSQGKGKTITKVKVVIDLVIYNSKGEEIKKLKSESVSKDKITVEYKTLAIGNFSIISSNENQSVENTFTFLFYDALEKLAKEL